MDERLVAYDLGCQARMLKTQKNQLLRQILDAGLQPTDFDWPESYRIRYVGPGATPGEFFFSFLRTVEPECYPDGFALVRSVGETEWSRHSRWFHSWLEMLVPEIEAPDLWAEVEQLRAAVRADAVRFEQDEGDLPFAGADRDQFVAALNQVRELLASDPQKIGPQLEAMQASIDRLERGSHSLGRKDVLTWLLGCVAGPVFSGVMTMENAHWLLFHLVQALTAVRVLVAPAVQALSG